MNFSRPLRFIAFIAVAITIALALNVAVTKKSFSENYPTVVCPPTLSGLSSQISLSSKDMKFQTLQDRSANTKAIKVLRLPVIKDSLLFDSGGSTPVVWQSRSGSWAGGALCSGPASSQWFVGASADITSKGRLIVVNSGLSDAVVDVNVFTENGKQPTRTLDVPSKNYLVISVDSLAPGDKTLTVNVLPRSGRINSFMIDEQGRGLRTLGGDLINPLTAPSKNLVVPAIPNQKKKPGQNAGSTNVLRVLTPGEVDASVTVELLSADGVFIPVGLNSRNVAAGLVTEFTFSPSISSPVFALKITSTEPVVAAVESSVAIGGRRDFTWSTAAPELTAFTMAVTGLAPLIAFSGAEINVALDVTLVNGKVVRKAIKGTDIATWKVPVSVRAFTITKVGKQTYAGALVSSVNGYGYFPIAPGSVLTRVEVPDSNIRILNP
jgi:hypothetical protein